MIRQALVHAVIFGNIAQIVKRHRGKPVQFAGFFSILPRVIVVQEQNLSWHGIDRAGAHGLEQPIAYPRNESQRADLCGQLPCRLPFSRWTVVNHDNRQSIFVTYLDELLRQPGAIGFGDRPVTLGGIVPGLEQGFGGHRINRPPYPGQNFKPPIENQPGVGVTLLEKPDRRDHAFFLLFSGFSRGGDQLIGIQRVEKKIAKPLLP